MADRRRPDPAALARAARRTPPATAGRGMGSPEFEARAPLPLREVAAPRALAARLLNAHNDHLRCYRLGECTVIVTREWGRWHASIAHHARYPTWDEIAEARYRILPDGVTVGLLLPPKSRYVNLHKNCFQLKEVTDPDEGA